MRIKTLLAVGAVMLIGIPAHAQDNTYARGYAVTAKDGMVAQFEAALKSHVQWRSENNDPWTWSVSAVEVGEHLGEYSIRSGGHSWADFDAYDAGFGPEGLVHWNATVAPLVESIASTVTTTDQALSNPPPAGTPYAFVTVTTFHVRPGRELQFNQAITSATEILREHNWGGHYLWSSFVLGGGTGPVMRLVSFHASWADMADPDPSFEAIMMQALGEEGFLEWVYELGQTYRGIESYTLRRRPDLGVNEN
jgi:hypothetical protein